MPMSKRSLSLIMGLALLASGCVSVFPESAPAAPRYHISAIEPSAFDGDVAPVSWSLLVDDPSATHVYNSLRIAVETGPGKVEFLAGAEWADRAPRLMQSALVESFENSGRILRVGDRSTLNLGDLKLQTDLRIAHLDVTGDGYVVEVNLYARLIDRRGNIVAARRFGGNQNISNDAPDTVVGAFNNIFTQLFGEITLWTFDTGAVVLEGVS